MEIELNSKFKHIAAILLGVLPFYAYSLYSNRNPILEYSVFDVLVLDVFLACLTIVVILVIQKYFLKIEAVDFSPHKGTLLMDVSVGMLAFILLHLVEAFGWVSYYHWFERIDGDRTAEVNAIRIIFSDKLYRLQYMGPAIWMSVISGEILRVFFLRNAWALWDNKYWVWMIIFISAGLSGLLQLHNGTRMFFDGFILSLPFSIIYYRYQRILPLIVAGGGYATVKMINFIVNYLPFE